jgi:hypothetical protein
MSKKPNQTPEGKNFKGTRVVNHQLGEVAPSLTLSRLMFLVKASPTLRAAIREADAAARGPDLAL